MAKGTDSESGKKSGIIRIAQAIAIIFDAAPPPDVSKLKRPADYQSVIQQKGG